MSVRKAIIESIQLDNACEVDEANGIIKNVRVLGSRSANCHDVPGVTEGTEYTRQAMESVLGLYENCHVNVAHNRTNPDSERNPMEVFGTLRDNRLVADHDGPAVRANLLVNRKHPMAAIVMEDVQRKMGIYGLSHHAFTNKARVHEGRYVVEAIGEVRGVDLVTRPATNKNLFESSESKPMKHTFRAVLESRKVKFPKIVKRLLEDGDMPIDVPVTDQPVDHDQAIDDAFVNAMKALVDSYASGDCKDAEMLSKLKQLVKAHKGIKGEDPKADNVLDEEEEKPADDESEKKKDEDVKESIRLQRENAALKCIIESGAKPTPIIMKMLLLCESDEDRKELLKERVTGSVVTSTVPGHAQQHTETIESDKLPDSKTFAAMIAG